MGRLVKANPEVEASKGQTTVVGTGTHGRLVRTGDVQRTSPAGNVVQKKPTVQPSKAATIPAKASSPMFRTQQNVVTPKNQSALAQNLAQGALQKKDAKNYQSKEAFNQHVKDVKPQTVTQRVGNTLKGAAKTYGAGFVNLSGVAAQGQGGTAMSPVYRSQAETLDQQIAALEATLSDPTMTAQDIADTKEAIAIARSEREKYGKIIESEEKTVEGAYDIADRLADSGTRDINKAEKWARQGRTTRRRRGRRGHADGRRRRSWPRYRRQRALPNVHA